MRTSQLVVILMRTSQLVVILMRTSNKVVLEGSAVEIGARECLCHPMLTISVIHACSMLTCMNDTYMTVSVTIPVTIVMMMRTS